MYETILNVGNRIEMKLLSGTKKEPDRYYYSKLQEMLEDNQAKISMPMDGGRLIPASAGERYQLCFYTKQGLYQCQCVVMNRFHERQLPMLTVRFVTDLERLQRRQYFRLQCLMDASYRHITSEELLLRERLAHVTEPGSKKQFEARLQECYTEWRPATILDISGGGVRFNSEEQLEKNSLIMLLLNVSDNNKIHTLMPEARVVASTEVQNRARVYEQRVEYQNISTTDREVIIRYIFFEERRRRQREKELR